MSFDPSIILAGKQYTGPDANDTMRTMADIALRRVQQQKEQASLTDLLSQQQQAQAVRQVYAQNANTPENLPTSLMGIGAGDVAAQWSSKNAQDQQRTAEANKLKQQSMMAAAEYHARPLVGVKDDAGIAAAKQEWRRQGVSEQEIAMMPDSYEQAKPYIDAIVKVAIPAEKQAEMTNKTNNARIVAGQQTRRDGTGQELQWNEEDGTFNIPVGKPKPPKPAGDSGGSVGGQTMSPESMMREAIAYNITHQMPSYGNGKAAAALKIQIGNLAAKIDKDGSFAANSAGYKADAGSLKNLQKQIDATEAFENTALKNLDVFITAMKAMPDAGTPFLNKPIREFDENFGGDPQMSKAIAARQTAISEVSKVLGGSTGGGAMSDSARHEAAELLKPGATPAQYMAVAETLKKDMANRMDTFSAQRQAILGRLGGGKKASGSGGGQKDDGKISVSNGKETLRIDPADLPHAKEDGYDVVKP